MSPLDVSSPSPSIFFDLPSACSSAMIAALTGALTSPLLLQISFVCTSPPKICSSLFWETTYHPCGGVWAVPPNPVVIVARCVADRRHFDAVGLSCFRGFPGLLRRNTPVHVPGGKDHSDLALPRTPHLTKANPPGLFSRIPQIASVFFASETHANVALAPTPNFRAYPGWYTRASSCKH